MTKTEGHLIIHALSPVKPSPQIGMHLST